MPTLQTGGCLCGAIRYESAGAPVFALQCHCRDCQKQSGAASVAAIRVPAAAFRITRGSPKRSCRSHRNARSLRSSVSRV